MNSDTRNEGDVRDGDDDPDGQMTSVRTMAAKSACAEMPLAYLRAAVVVMVYLLWRWCRMSHAQAKVERKLLLPTAWPTVHSAPGCPLTALLLP